LAQEKNRAHNAEDRVTAMTAPNSGLTFDPAVQLWVFDFDSLNPLLGSTTRIERKARTYWLPLNLVCQRFKRMERIDRY
jgi:hypothetical protein